MIKFEPNKSGAFIDNYFVGFLCLFLVSFLISNFKNRLKFNHYYNIRNVEELIKREPQLIITVWPTENELKLANTNANAEINININANTNRSEERTR